jgi:AcrR family transcriptional regulator
MQNAAVVTIDSKQAILNAAEGILNRSGYAGLSMRELSRESGLAKSTLYHYFEDKHQIYLSVVERDMVEFREQILAAIDTDGNAVERLRSMISAYFTLLNERGIIALHAFRRSGDLECELSDLFREHRPKMMDPLIEVVQEGIDEGLFRPVNAELTVVTIFGMVNGFLAQRLISGDDSKDYTGREAELADHTISLLLDGLMEPQSLTTEKL